MLNLMHVGLHGRINLNAGDTLLFEAVRKSFSRFLGEVKWHLQPLWEPFNADVANQYDGIVVGGGGLLLPDQDGAKYDASGWQWNCTFEALIKIDVPLIFFAIGDNRFRGQDYNPWDLPHFLKCIMKADFLGVREKAPGWESYQPCPTTCLWQLYGDDMGSKIAYRQTLGLNVATDRGEHRFSGKMHDTFTAIAGIARSAIEQGYRIELMCHKVDDRAIEPYLNARGTPYVTRELWNKSPREIIRAYQDVDVVAGMRGHAQLIPFGMRKPIISLISHDKLKRFLDDIGHPEWGVEVLDPDFFEKACELIAEAKSFERQKAITDAQVMCWDITHENMKHIGKILGVEVSDAD